MRWILTAAFTLLVCSGCSSGSRDDSSRSAGPGACASRITWNGDVYYGSSMNRLPPATLMLGTGGRPTCLDLNGGEAGASSTVRVRRLVGVDPRVAVAVQGEPDAAYLARGYFVQLPSHPLHGALQPSARTRSELRGCAGTRAVSLEGTIRYRTGAVVGVSTGESARGRYVGAEAALFVDAHTRVRALSRAGLPYVPLGQRVSVEAVACLWSDGRLRKLVPRRIAPA